ncbi:hypothetical protein ACPV5O_21210 [Vibrio maritimus]|uniref:hypothetical protein n=1 Tax=Vibrio maritimus TaxID=990268 RepID=UPI0040681F0F
MAYRHAIGLFLSLIAFSALVQSSEEDLGTRAYQFTAEQRANILDTASIPIEVHVHTGNTDINNPYQQAIIDQLRRTGQTNPNTLPQVVFDPTRGSFVPQPFPGVGEPTMTSPGQLGEPESLGIPSSLLRDVLLATPIEPALQQEDKTIAQSDENAPNEQTNPPATTQPKRLSAIGEELKACITKASLAEEVGDVSQICQLMLAELSLDQERINYQLKLIEHNTSMLKVREELYKEQVFQGNVIAIFVGMIMVAGIVLAWLQFRRDGKGSGNENKSSRTALKLGALEIESPVIGLIILALSLFFFDSYIEKVYTIHDAANSAPLSQGKK